MSSYHFRAKQIAKRSNRDRMRTSLRRWLRFERLETRALFAVDFEPTPYPLFEDDLPDVEYAANDVDGNPVLIAPLPVSIGFSDELFSISAGDNLRVKLPKELIGFVASSSSRPYSIDIVAPANLFVLPGLRPLAPDISSSLLRA